MLGLSQEEMARACNTHPMTISKWDRGIRKPSGQAVRLIELMIELYNLYLWPWYRKQYIERAENENTTSDTEKEMV